MSQLTDFQGTYTSHRNRQWMSRDIEPTYIRVLMIPGTKLNLRGLFLITKKERLATETLFFDQQTWLTTAIKKKKRKKKKKKNKKKKVQKEGVNRGLYFMRKSFYVTFCPLPLI